MNDFCATIVKIGIEDRDEFCIKEGCKQGM